MKTKKVFAFLAIAVLLVLAGLIVFIIFDNPSVPDVVGTEVSSADDSSVTLHWHKDSVDGYFVYQDLPDKGFVRIGTVADPEKPEYVITDLDSATEYSFYVSAFKTRRDRDIESESYEAVSACTTPKQQEIAKLESPDPGELYVEWFVDSNSVGYQLQYVKGNGDDFSSATTVDIDDNTKVKYSLKKLAEKKVYSVRVRSYCMFANNRLYGKWSAPSSVTIEEKIQLANGIDISKPMVALTFDDGPGYNSASDDILDVLEKYKARATFFMVGRNAADHPKNLKRKADLGMELGNHTYSHDHYGKNVTASDIKSCSEAIYKACGKYPTAFRSPGGNTTDAIRKECSAEKMPLYYWSLDTQDWKNRDADKIYNYVMKNVSDGDIILMHEIYPSTAKAVEKMVPELIKQGYQLVTCEELVKAKTGKNPKVGQQYFDGDTINNKTR